MQRRKISKKTVGISLGIGVFVVAVSIGTSVLLQQQASDAQNTATQADRTTGFTTLTPNNATIDTLGGWTRVSPPENDPVYAYADTVGGVAISVSQQPLPKSFENNTSQQVAELAKQYNATVTISASGTTAYIGTSADGPQSVIFTKNNLLVLIKSQQTLDDTSWKDYITSLN